MPDYGTDLNLSARADGLLDLSERGDLVDGNAMLLQAARIRLSTARGSVLDAPDDGIDLTDYLSRPMSNADAAQLESVIEAELAKDGRFTARATVDAADLLVTQSFEVALELDAGAGPFAGVLAVSAAGVFVQGD